MDGVQPYPLDSGWPSWRWWVAFLWVGGWQTFDKLVTLMGMVFAGCLGIIGDHYFKNGWQTFGTMVSSEHLLSLLLLNAYIHHPVERWDGYSQFPQPPTHPEKYGMTSGMKHTTPTPTTTWVELSINFALVHPSTGILVANFNSNF